MDRTLRRDRVQAHEQDYSCLRGEKTHFSRGAPEGGQDGWDMMSVTCGRGWDHRRLPRV